MICHNGRYTAYQQQSVRPRRIFSASGFCADSWGRVSAGEEIKAMADQFRIDSAEVGAVADGLAGLGAAMTGHVSSLRAGLAGAGAPWGSDVTGDQFAGVPQGFVAHMQAWLQTMGAHAEKVQRHAGQLTAAVGVFEQADQG
jgi:hypothetical protein